MHERDEKPAIQPIFYRKRDGARVLTVSESQFGKFVRQGLITPIRIPGIRAVRYAREDVEALAEQWRATAVNLR